MKISHLIPMILLLFFASCQQDKVLYQSEKFTVYADRVEQGPYTAKVVSENEIVSNYQSPVNAFLNATFGFKFSINSRDNEMLPGKDHLITLRPENGLSVSPLIRFGEQSIDTIDIEGYIPVNTIWKIRLDMRHVFEAFETDGYFTFFNGDRLYKEDFKGVFIAGGTSALSWDFENLLNNDGYKLKDPDGDGIFELEINMNPDGVKVADRTWKLSQDISGFPQYTSDQSLIDALYRMSIDEMLLNIRPDGAFMAGKEWGGVWTRDISYAIHLAFAAMHPEASKASLMHKVKNKRIIQDTGTGGSWPASTDRTVWAIAAWEVYLVTGDQNWLEEAFEILQNTWNDDLKVAFNDKTGLYFGESSFLDWREQTYPKWMLPVDIYMSQNLGTNAAHYQMNRILAMMAKQLNQPYEAYESMASRVKNGMNDQLWMPEKGYYAQYIYGRNHMIVSPRAEALGEALSILFDIPDAERQQKIVASTPVSEFGIPSIWPQIPGIQPYHNNGIWPFVQGYWILAAAKTKNEAAVIQSIASIYRQAALFATNKENFVATTGDYKGTAINSDRQLWSVAANISLVLKVYFGMDYQVDGLHFKPFIPETLHGNKSLKAFPYRNATLDIEVVGTGHEVLSFELDGEKTDRHFIPAELTGHHKLIIKMGGSRMQHSFNKTEVPFSALAPACEIVNETLIISHPDENAEFVVYRNGVELTRTSQRELSLGPVAAFEEYMVTALNSDKLESFSCEPLLRFPKNALIEIQAEDFAPSSALPYRGFTGKGFAAFTKTENTRFSFTVNVDETAIYAISFRYSNGSGPVNTDNKCGIRTLFANSESVGAVVLPQRGIDEWSNWGYSNMLNVPLQKGRNNLSLDFISPENENMNFDVNTFMLDAVRLIKIVD
ncbi:MAG: hypothetical protein Q8J88_18405 [Bacteroidales bacterium]|nr:hypothetical protein [Bacteroidales bacterium]